MTFASLTFLYFFLPFALLLYYLCPRRYRNALLLGVNLVFYGWGEPAFLLVIAGSTIVNFFFGRAIGKTASLRNRKLLALAAIACSLSLLAFFKYTNWISGMLAQAGLPVVQSQIPLPLGISFYTFHVISYIVDVYRRDVQPQRSLLQFGTYMTLFPQMVAGPIVRYKDMQPQLVSRRENLAQFADGFRLLAIGLAKKVLVANQLGLLWSSLQQSAGENGVIGAWGGAFAFTLQIYFDFSGYSDMARGLGKMLGFELPLNFSYPYVSASVTEFWRRWHISLSTWFRDYVYIPLGGSRRGMGRTICNLLVVWGLTGLWHGASWNFLLWGLYYFVLLTIEKLFLKKWLDRTPAWVGHFYALFCVVLGWVLFAYEDFGALGTYVGQMFGAGGLLPGENARVQLLQALPLLVVGAVACLPLGSRLYVRVKHRRFVPVVEAVLCAAALLLSTASLVSQSYNPFLYARF